MPSQRSISKLGPQSARIDKVKKFLSRFGSNERGNIIIMFAMMAIPLFVLGGGAIDLSRATSARSQLQAACDAAALAGMRSRFNPSTNYTTTANTFFTQNVSSEFQSVTPNVVLSTDGLTLDVSADASIATTTLSLVNVNTIDISVTCSANYGTLLPLEVAFVMDYSSSMYGSAGNGLDKWEAMRDATQQLVHQLTANGTFPDAHIAFIPFAKFVRTTMSGDYFRGETTSSDITRCVTDRDYPYNIDDSTPDGADPTKWPTTTHSTCGLMDSNSLEVMPLTNNSTLINTTLQNYSPASGTNIQIGLAHGWHVLSQNLPYDEGTNYNDPDLPKVLILLSDGRHNQDGNGPGGVSSSSQAELNIEDMCTAIKDEGVTIFTIAYDITDNDTRIRLRECSSEPNTETDHPYYFEPFTGQDLFGVFAGIGYQLNPDSLTIK